MRPSRKKYGLSNTRSAMAWRVSLGAAGNVRQQHHVVEPNSAARHVRLVLEYVQPGAGDALSASARTSAASSTTEPRHVDHEAARAERVQHRVVHQVACLRRRR